MKKSYSFESFFVSGPNLETKNTVQKYMATPEVLLPILSIVGKAGVGKSHLLWAIENQLVKEQLYSNILYIDSVELVSKLMFAEKNNLLSKLGDKFISLDFLIVDTVKFLEHHRSCHVFLLNIISELVNRNRRIVLAHSEINKDEHGFIGQLVNRFSIQEVNLSELSVIDRVALLNNLSKRLYIDISADVTEYFALQTGNPRVLENLFNRVVANAKYLGKQIDLSFTQSVLG